MPTSPVFLSLYLTGARPARLENPIAETATAGQVFVFHDRQYDLTRSGCRWFDRAELADMARWHVRRLAESEGHYDLHAYVVMPNHLHLLLTPKLHMPELLRHLKTAIAGPVGKQLHRPPPQPFWQRDCFPRVVRHEAEFQSLRSYIERNPVHAGLARTPEAYAWSSAATASELSAIGISA